MIELEDEEDGRVALLMDKEELPFAVEALMRAGYVLTSPSEAEAEEPEAEAEEQVEPEEPDEPEAEAEEPEEPDEPEAEAEEPEEPDEPEAEAEEPEEPEAEAEEPERRVPVRRRQSRARTLWPSPPPFAAGLEKSRRGRRRRRPMVELKDEEDGRVALIMDKEELPFAVEGFMRAGYVLTAPSKAEDEEPEEEQGLTVR